MRDTGRSGMAKAYRADKDLIPNFLVLSLLLCIAVLTTACATPSQGASSTSNNTSTGETGATISISPSIASLISEGQQQFTAKVSGTPNTAVTWSASTGAISSSGAFAAPKVTSNTSVTITATSAANPSWHKAVTVMVNPLGALTIANSTLPEANTNTPYSATLSATGGLLPYQWSIASGVLPSGIYLQASSGAITGITALASSYPFIAKVTDASGHSATAAFSLTVSTLSASGFDGPAELPLIYVQSAMSDTPAPASTSTVHAGENLQSALNSANCGDTIQLQAGATFSGVFTLPAKSCDDNHWIIVRTSAPDSSLPPEGTRMTPCYAGLTSLPGRPAFNCTVTNNVMAKIEFSGVGSGPFLLQDGANHYRFIGLEITRTPATGIVHNLVSRQNQGAADHVIFDRSWLHGTAQDETQRGIMLSGTSYAAVVDSYFSDFHCVSWGDCTDSQAIGGGMGDLASGPLKIVDNFLEAAGENILLGGGEATTTPADIEIRFNHMFKPMSWKQGQPGYVGGVNGNPFIVKNLFELKNAQRVLLEGNILENNWGGFTQHGSAVLLTPKNQDSGTANVCPLCQVTDVTIRYGTISHAGGAFQIANGDSRGAVALAGERYSIHDLIVDDLDATKYNGYGNFAQVSMGKKAPVLQSVTINHVTALQTGVMLNLGDDISVNPVMNNFVFTNNIVNAGPVPTETVGGGPTNCAYYSAPLTSLGRCFEPYTFSNNAIIATPAEYPPSKYPPGNFFPANSSAAQFVNYNNGNGGNYQLVSTSPYRNAGTDGKDLGADVEAIEAAIAGVE